MTNSPVMRDHARYLAGRLLDLSPDNQPKQIEDLYVRALSRRPTADETGRRDSRPEQARMGAGKSILRAEKSDAPVASTAKWYALADLCQAVLSSAEFAYID